MLVQEDFGDVRVRFRFSNAGMARGSAIEIHGNEQQFSGYMIRFDAFSANLWRAGYNFGPFSLERYPIGIDINWHTAEVRDINGFFQIYLDGIFLFDQCDYPPLRSGKLGLREGGFDYIIVCAINTSKPSVETNPTTSLINTTLTPSKPVTPAPTFTPIPITTYVQLDPSGCAQTTVLAGRIIFGFGAGGSPGQEKESVIADIGDTAAVITVNNQPTTPLSVDPFGNSLDSRGRTIEIQGDQRQWNHATYTQALLEAGTYTVAGVWARNDQTERRSCALTVIAP